MPIKIISTNHFNRKSLNFLLLGIFMMQLLACRQVNTDHFTDVAFKSELHNMRLEQLSNISYFLYYDIHDAEVDTASASLVLSFGFHKTHQPLILDFADAGQRLRSVRHQGQEMDFQTDNDYIIIPSSALDEGENQLELSFVLKGPLHKQPANRLATSHQTSLASELFPCFNQPDLKASFLLNLQIPIHWQAVSVASVLRAQPSGNRLSVAFARSRIISPAMFYFVAGTFDTLSFFDEQAVRNDLFLPQGSGQQKAEQAAALAAQLQRYQRITEEYIGVEIPFNKTDVVFLKNDSTVPQSFPGLYVFPEIFLSDSIYPITSGDLQKILVKQVVKQWVGGLVSFTKDQDRVFQEALVGFISEKVIAAGKNPSVASHEIENTSLHGDKSKIYHKLEMAADSITDSLFRAGLSSFVTSYSWGSASETDFFNEMDMAGK